MGGIVHSALTVFRRWAEGPSFSEKEAVRERLSLLRRHLAAARKRNPGNDWADEVIVFQREVEKTQDLLRVLHAGDAEPEHERLVWNERTKLTAAWFDRASTALFTAGVATPLAARLFGIGTHMPLGQFLAVCAIFAAGSAIGHAIARDWLRGLRP